MIKPDKLDFFFGKYSFISNSMTATRSKKADTGACLPWCYITFPFNNIQ